MTLSKPFERRLGPGEETRLFKVLDGLRRPFLRMVLTCVGICMWALLGGGMDGARAQSAADTYFHEAAKAYIANEVSVARRAVNQGLAVAPSDSRLRALQEKLRQNRRSPSRADSAGTTEGGNDGNEENGSGSSGERGENRSESSERSNGDRDDSETSGVGASGDRSPADGRASARPADSLRPGRGGRPVDTLSQDQAERLLQALEGQERRLLRQLHRRSAAPRSVEKDW